MKWKLAANTELDEYIILCLVNKDNLLDFMDIIKEEIGIWKECEVIVSIKRLICSIEKGDVTR